MKTNKILFATLLTGAAMVFTSCGDSFLKEELLTERDKTYFDTQAGLDDLVIGSYSKLKFKFNYEWGYNLWNSGVDEFMGGNTDKPAWHHYSNDLNSQEKSSNKPLWDNMYGLVEPANMIIQNVPLYYDAKSSTYNTRLGEGYFFRAFAFFELVKQFGGVPLKLTPSTKIEYQFARNTEEECYKQILEDFEKAYELLPESPEDGQVGRLTKWAAAHYLAKAHLFRTSELYASWNGQYVDQDLDAVIKYGKEVIAAHPLCSNFQELWDYTEPDGKNEMVSEVVLAAQFSDNVDTHGRYGNQMHLYFPSIYQDIKGCKRDISGDREFSCLASTEYDMQVFDRVNDSRFWKSFITKYGCNSPKDVPGWDEKLMAAHPEAFPEGVKAGEKRFKGGETAIKYIVNEPGDDRYTDLGTKRSYDEVCKDGILQREHTFVRYYKGQSFSWNMNKDRKQNVGNELIDSKNKRYVAISKFRDGYRQNKNDQFGTRDGILARSADDVLMVAEAYIRKKDYANAIIYLNMVRDRAGYADGEDRSISRDGGQAYKKNSACAGKGGGHSADGAIYTEQNSYYESNNIAVTTAATKSNMHLNSIDDVLNSKADSRIYEALGCSSTAEKMMCFLLNERTRELIGESHRWEDLARTKTLEKRWKTFNPSAVAGIGMFDPAKHYYRPIPQSFLDGLTNPDGSPLSSEQKAALQNPGY